MKAKSVLALALVVTFLFVISSQSRLSATVQQSPFLPGHVLAGVGNGLVQHYDANGNLLGTLDTGTNSFTTGCAFDSSGNLYQTTFDSTGVVKFNGPGTPHTNLGQFGTGYNGSVESIVFDSVGNFYVGTASGDTRIRKYDPLGNFIENYGVQTEVVGSDWIDLANDQRTIYYTSEGKRIMRYDTVTRTQLPDFVSSLPGSNAFALRILPDGGVLVADREFVLRLDNTGKKVREYDVSGEDTWFSLNLDPDGTSFWAGNFGSGRLYRFDIGSGNQLDMIDTGVGSGRLYGICVYGELTIAIEDDDQDGLLNEWEEEGFDFDNDGTVDVDLPGMGADPKKKDVFVYIDWLEKAGLLGHDHHPGNALDVIVEAFENAPVTNEDSSDGVKLHIIFGEAIPENDQSSELGLVSGNCEYSWDEFDNLKSTYLPQEYSPIFHYAIFAHDLPVFSCIGGRPSGISRNGSDFETGASDFIVSLGAWEELGEVIYAASKAGTFMHELGHNLGLGHGGLIVDEDGNVSGVDHTNFKPNHLSVMNYSFQTRGIRMKTKIGIFPIYVEGYMDYSRFGRDDLPDLDENNLNEESGFQASDSVSEYGTRYFCPNGENRKFDGLQNPIDWNCDGDESDQNLIANITNDPQGALTTLSSANEWEHLVFDGGAVGAFGSIPDLPETTSMEESPELTIEEDKDLGSYGPYKPEDEQFGIALPVIQAP